jgi:hypothetical protein
LKRAWAWLKNPLVQKFFWLVLTINSRLNKRDASL